MATSKRDSRLEKDPVEIGSTKIMEEFENKEQVEKKASGIDAENDELDQLCQDIKERMEEVSSQEEAESAKKNAESEKAASMR